MNFIICNWTTYSGSHCRRNIDHSKKCTRRYCNLHKELIIDYEKLDDSEESCETFEEIKIVPRSYKHLKSVMASMDNDDDFVDIYMQGGLIERADITNENYIVLISDNCRYYYDNPKNSKNANKAKDLKVILRRYCQTTCVISVRETKYCEDCYKKLKNVPRISAIHKERKERKEVKEEEYVDEDSDSE